MAVNTILGLTWLSQHKLAWVEELPITSNGLIEYNYDGSYKFRSFSPLVWNEANWRLVAQNSSSSYSAAYSERMINLYLEMERPPDAQGTIARSVKVIFYLIGTEESNYLATRDHCFDYELTEYSNPADYGETCCFGKALSYLTSPEEGFLHPMSPAQLELLRTDDEDAQYRGCLRIGVRVELVPPSKKKLPLFTLKSSSKDEFGMVGLANLGATCYLNALLQMLYHIPGFRRAVYNMPVTEPPPNTSEEVSYSISFAVQSVFRNLQIDDREVSPLELTKALGWTSMQAFMQEDVQEMLRILLDKLEELMKDTGSAASIGDLFKGKITTTMRCLDIDFESRREEDFYDIQLDVKGCSDIYESLRQYTTKETLEGENQYDAGEGRGKHDAEKGILFTDLPPVLTIHLKRFQFDMVKMGFSKIHDMFSFPSQLDMTPFLETPTPTHTEDAVEDVEPADKRPRSTYSLHSVLVHSGDVGGGHYYAFIRPEARCYTDHSPQWYKFDDELVLQATEQDAVQSNFGRSKQRLSYPQDLLEELSPDAIGGGPFSIASAYMLVYVRNNELPELMRPVTMEDIPTSLASQLDVEKRRRHLANRSELHQKRLMELHMYTEAAVQAWHELSTENDFVDFSSVELLTVPKKDVTVLGLWCLVASTLRCSPHCLRLFYVVECESGDDSEEDCGLRILDALDVWDFPEDQARLQQDTSGVYAHVEQSHEQHQELTAAYDELLSEEEALREEMRQYATRSKDMETWQQFVGIGRGMEFIRREFVDSTEANEVVAKWNALGQKALAIASCSVRLHRDDRLVFFRAYDPFNDLPLGDETAVPGDAFHFKFSHSAIIRLWPWEPAAITESVESQLELVLGITSPEVQERWRDLNYWVARFPSEWSQLFVREGPEHITMGDIIYFEPENLGDHRNAYEWNHFQLYKRKYTLEVDITRTGDFPDVTLELIQNISLLDLCTRICAALKQPHLLRNVLVYLCTYSRLDGNRNSKLLDSTSPDVNVPQVRRDEKFKMFYRISPFVRSECEGCRLLDIILVDPSLQAAHASTFDKITSPGIAKRQKRMLEYKEVQESEVFHDRSMLLCVDETAGMSPVIEYLQNRLKLSNLLDREGLILYMVTRDIQCSAKLCHELFFSEANEQEIKRVFEKSSWMETPMYFHCFAQKCNIEYFDEYLEGTNSRGIAVLFCYITRGPTGALHVATDVYQRTPFIHFVLENDSPEDIYKRIGGLVPDMLRPFELHGLFSKFRPPLEFELLTTWNISRILSVDRSDMDYKLPRIGILDGEADAMVPNILVNM